MNFPRMGYQLKFCWRTYFVLAVFLFGASHCYFPSAKLVCSRSMGSSLVPRRSKRLRENDDLRLQASKDAQEAEIRSTTTPMLRAGLLADIQYAPIPDGFSYSGSPRYYQHALDVARSACIHFEQEKVDVVLNLGDIVDGKCQSIVENGGKALPSDRDVGEQCVEHVMEALSHYKNGDILHSYGNHCLYNMDRQTLQKKLGIPFVKEPCGDLVGYYSSVKNGVRFVVLDSYDIALMGRCEKTSNKHREATEILKANNPNFPAHENSPEGMNGLAKRFVAFNGGIGQMQLEWLRNTLSEARKKGDKVIILSHQPILPGSSSPVCLVWNYSEVLHVLRDFRDVVTASFSGHAHKGGYRRDEKSGIHFRVFEAALENPDPHKTYAMVSVHDDRLEITGFGNCESAVYNLDHNLAHSVSLKRLQ